MKVAVLICYDAVARGIMGIGSDCMVRVAGRDHLIETLKDADALVVANAGLGLHYVDEEALRCAERLKLVQMCGVSHDALDLDAALARGIMVATVPEQNTASVAEAAILLLLAAARRQRGWSSAIAASELGAPYGTELSGKSLCVVGFGKIGTLIARVAKALGMHLALVNREPRFAAAAALGARAAGIADLPEALASADCVVLSLPLGRATVGMFDARLFDAMKPGSALINISRGAVVVRQDLEAALNSGRLASYAADVWWDEPADPEDPLLRREEVLLSPHIGGATKEVLERTISIVAANLALLGSGHAPRHLVPAAWAQERGSPQISNPRPG